MPEYEITVRVETDKAIDEEALENDLRDLIDGVVTELPYTLSVLSDPVAERRR